MTDPGDSTIGSRVLVTHNPAHDREYGQPGVEARRAVVLHFEQECCTLSTG